MHALSVSTIAKVVSSNPTHGDTYSIQHYFIKFAYTKTDLNSLTNITLERVYINVAKCRVWHMKVVQKITFTRLSMITLVCN
jgi:hypothetical protein